MTLTRLIPTLRASIPDPLDPRLWPPRTTATTTDVLVDGLSLLHVAHVGGSPSTSPDRAAGRVPSVIVVRVVAVAEHPDGEPVVFIDGDADAAGAVWEEARLIGRVSTVRDRVAAVRPAPPYGTSATRSVALLPGDLREGDLLAMPCTVRAPGARAVPAPRSSAAMPPFAQAGERVPV